MDVLSVLKSFSGTFFTTLVFCGIYFLLKYFFDKQKIGRSHQSSILRTIILFTLALVAIISIILSLPFSESMKGQISSLIGIILAAVLTLSSATFVGNAFAGIMLRVIDNFKPGDFIKVGDYFGRISERGLFHTEIQTENRDLTTLPNLFLATNPVQVTASTGSFISATCSLGYDVSRVKIEKALLEAAKKAELQKAFVLIEELGDYSVVYLVRGLLKDIDTLIGSRSRLNAMVLDALHEAGIEIVSPTFMNQRQVDKTVFIPQKHIEPNNGQNKKPDAFVFDKAEEAKTVDQCKERISEINDHIKTQKELITSKTSEEDKIQLEKKIERLNNLKKGLEKRINEFDQ